ncbi:hypothetical protein PVAP13_9NG098973 [Panicum virgatum]|uniref:Uncharacterized protein n=1 Tax=Panicum virgatum TaxID=38727 RepID=A0A8T0MDU0_PANVG|nr:hypothetical protein PVAP13_9NG098973 [Panicum virgatum]
MIGDGGAVDCGGGPQRRATERRGNARPCRPPPRLPHCRSAPCLRRAALPPAMAATSAEPALAAAPSRLHRRVCAVHRPCAVPPSRQLHAAAPCRLAVEQATTRHHGLRPRPPSGLPTSARTHARVRRRRSSLTVAAVQQRPASTAVARACGRRTWRRRQRLCSRSLLSNEQSPPRVQNRRHVSVKPPKTSTGAKVARYYNLGCLLCPVVVVLQTTAGWRKAPA